MKKQENKILKTVLPPSLIKSAFLLTFLIIALAVSLPHPASAAIIISRQITTALDTDPALVGWWTFDGRDCGATYCVDKSGGGNTGTLTNGPTKVSGKVGQGLSFNGSSSHVNLDSAVANFRAQTAGTISAWVRPNSSGSGRSIVALGKTAGGADLVGYLLYLTEGKFEFKLHKWSSGPGTQNKLVLTTNNTFSPGVWYHVVMTNDTSGNALYVDGVQQAVTYDAGFNASTDAWFDNLNVDGPLNIMRIGMREYAGSLGMYWDGGIDDVRIYSRALSVTEVASLYNQTAPRFSLGAKRLDPISKTGLVAHWTFNDKDCSTTYCLDKSNEGNNATAVVVIPAAGRIAQGISIPTTNNVLDFGESAEMTTDLDQMTVAVWAKMPGANQQNVVISWSKGLDAPNNQEAWIDIDTRTSQNYVRYGVLTPSGCNGTTPTDSFPNDQKWHHVVVVKPSSVNEPSGFPSVYIDGELQSWSSACGSSNIWFAPGYQSFSGLDENYIGVLKRDSYIAKFSGVMDDLRVYNRILSASEISTLYNYGLGSTPYNDGQNTVIINSTAQSNKTLTSGLVGHWTFDGPDCGATYCVDKSGGGNTGTLTNGPTKVSGKIGQGLSFDGSDDLVTATVSGTNAVTYWYKQDGSWIMNASSTNTTYVNGSIASLAVDPVLIEGTAVQIGNTGSVASPAYFNGRIDDVRIYDRALSAPEVAELYNLGR